MTYLAEGLKHRIKIQEAVQTPNDEGGFDRNYTTLTTIWAKIKKQKGNTSDYIAYIRGESITDSPTHEFVVRFSAIELLGREYNKGFSNGFDSIEDLSPVKADRFIFLKSGSIKGRLFRITGSRRDEENKEFMIIETREIEEQNTGWPA